MNDINLITLDDFINDEIDRLRNFKMFWESNQITDQVTYPREMSIGNWTDQIDIFYDLRVFSNHDQ